MSIRHLLAAAVLTATPTMGADIGPVEVWFTETPAAVSDKLALICADRSASVIEQDDRHIVCQRKVSGGKGILAQALLGNSYSTDPQLVVRFAILRDGHLVRVQASQWIEVQMAGGQTRRTDLNDRKQRASIEDTLLRAGGHNAPPDAADAAPKP